MHDRTVPVSARFLQFLARENERLDQFITHSAKAGSLGPDETGRLRLLHAFNQRNMARLADGLFASRSVVAGAADA